MKYKLTYLDGCGDFHTTQRELWDLQRQTREILNRTIQMAYHWDYTDYEHFKETGEHLNVLLETGYKRYDGYIYNRIKDRVPNFASVNISATIQAAWKKYNSVKTDVSRGELSLPSYKRDQPLVLHNQSIKLTVENGKPMIAVTLFSGSYKKEKGYGNVRFAVHLDDKTQRAIFHNILIGDYGLGQCQISYERPNWNLTLTYNFEPEKRKLDAEKVLGVDMGETVAIYASSYGEFGSLRIDGGEVTEFAARLEARRKSMQRQAAVCGEGRIGHGTRTRVADVYRAKEKIANFRDTINHRYSKKLVDYAIQHQYGVIQMEDLSGIKGDMDTSTAKFLRHWTYYDLQQKIEYKAKEVGIKVVKVTPAYTSQRCSKCGYIDSGNRPSQAKFKCLKCGFDANADFNASQNLSIPKIDEIIQEEMSENRE
jgi:IS605 OrfB family transposase